MVYPPVGHTNLVVEIDYKHFVVEMMLAIIHENPAATGTSSHSNTVIGRGTPSTDNWKSDLPNPDTNWPERSSTAHVPGTRWV